MTRFAVFSSLRWRVAGVAAVAVVAAGLAGGVPQAASAAPVALTAPVARMAPAARPTPTPPPPLTAQESAAAAAVAAYQAQEQARQSGKATVVAGDQTSFSQTVANPDGSFTNTSSVQPRWVRSGSSWAAADPTLVEQPDGSYAPKAALGDLTLSGGGPGALATEDAGSARLSVTWPGSLPAPTVSGARATYADVLPGVDLVVTAGVGGQFSDTLVIRDKAAAADPGLAALRLGVSASGGLTARAGGGGSLAEDDPSGRAVFYSPPPLAWDSRRAGAGVDGPGPGGAGAVVAPASYSGGDETLGVPASLAADPAADFPLYVDPSYNVSNWWWDFGMDQSAQPTLNDEDSTPGSLVDVGYDGGVDRGEFVFGPAAPADAAPVTITAATLTDEVYTAGSSASVNHTVNVYSTSEYTSSTTWNSPPTVLAGPAAASFTTTSATPDQNVSWNVASFLQAAYNANPWEMSLQLQNADETDQSAYLGFSCNPTLTYTYTQPAPVIPAGTGPAANATFLSFPISDKATLKVNVGSGDALITTSDLTLPQAGVTLGLDYNSLLADSVTGGAAGAGWRMQGADTRLYLGAGTGTGTASGPVTYLGPDGVSGVFTPPASGNLYTSPAALHATLTSLPTGPCGSGSVYELTWHSTGQVMCFNNAGMLTAQYDRNGNDTAFSYAGNGQETQAAYTPEGLSSPTETVTAAYTGSYLTSLSESGGSAGTKTISYSTNPDDGVSVVKQADGTTITMGYDGSEDPTSIENGTGATTTITYNSAHQVTSVTQPYGSGGATATTRFSYVSATETQVAAPNTSQSTPVGSVPNTQYTINSQAQVTATKDPGGNTTSTAYNSATDNVASSTNQFGGTTTDTWGMNNGESLTKSASPTGASQSWAYGNAATGADPTAQYLPSSSTDAQSNVTGYTYNGPGNLASAENNTLAATAKVTDNADGTPATSTDPANGTNSTVYAYNSLHQLTKVTPPTGSSLTAETLTYDGFGRVATVADGNGNTLTYTYDLADRVTQEAWTGGSRTLTVKYFRDGAGNLHTMTDPSGTTTWTYDGRNEVLTKNAQAGGGTLSYSYDADGNMLTAADGAGTTSYAYNTLDQLSSMTDPTGVQWQFGYDAAGDRTRTYYNATSPAPSSYGAEEQLSFDNAGRINLIKATGNSGAATLGDTTYCYSPYVSGQACPTASASTDTETLRYSDNLQSGVITQYAYDAGNRLKTATPTSGTTYSYTYDSDGNLKTGATAGSLAYNSANQISTSGYAYDGDGNLTTDPSNGTLAYNDASQLTGASAAAGGGGGSAAETIAYAGAGQNQPLTDGSATNITYGLADQYGQARVDSYTTAGATDYIIRDPQGDPLGIISAGHSYIYLTDNSGSIIGISGSCGCSDASYTYTPYGALVSKSAGSGGSLVTQNLLGYTGALTDAYTAGSTGYVHDGARWYNPKTGAFAGQDTNSYLASPANGNRYAYAGDDPANDIDPTGNLSFSIGISACFIVCGEGSVSIGTGGISTTLGYGAGTAGGLDASATLGSGDGTADGSGTEYGCEGFGYAGSANSAGEIDGGISTATEIGCEEYHTQSNTVASW